MVYGGVHEVSDENRLLFSFNDFGTPSFLVENTESASPTQTGRRMSKVSVTSFSKYSELGRSRLKQVNSKKFFLESDIERKFYTDEFILESERDKNRYREPCKQLEEMKKSLLEFGIFKNEYQFYRHLADEKFKEQPERRATGEDSDQEMLRQTSLKEAIRPIPREGHHMFILKDRLVIVGGMRHTLALNDIYFILCSSLQIIPMHITNQLDKEISLPNLD